MRLARRPGRLQACCVALCAGLAAWTTERRAGADTSFGLSWKVPTSTERCVEETALRESVEARLGRSTFTELANADIVIEAEETSVGQGEFRARVTERDRLGNARGVRELKAQSCPSLRRAATLIVALIIDPYRNGKRPDEPGEAAPPPPPAPASDRVEEVGREEPRPPRPERVDAPSAPVALESRKRTWNVALGLGAGSSVGVLPSASVTLFAVVRLEPSASRWSFDWSGGYSFPQRVSDGAVHADFSAVEQRLRTCVAVVRLPASVLDGCAGLAVGAILPDTVGVQSGSDHWRLLVGPTAAVAFDMRRGPIGGRVELGLTWGLRQHDFSYFDLANERKGFYSTETFVFFVSLSGIGKFS